MMDSRIIDVHFSRAFMRLVLDHELPLTVAAVKVRSTQLLLGLTLADPCSSSSQTVDKDLGYSLAHLETLVDSKRALENDADKVSCAGCLCATPSLTCSTSQTDVERAADMAKIESTVNDLTLDFTLPGYDIDLKEGGSEISVDSSNLEEYISLVIDWTLRRGIMVQLKEFKAGFSTGEVAVHCILGGR